MTRRIVLSLAATLVALVTATVGPTPARAQSAEALIEEGLELRRQHRDEQALERFQRAYEIAHAPRALAQIALAEQALGRYVPAEQHLVSALSVQMDPWIAERRSQLEQALGQIRAQLGTVEIQGGVEGAQVFVNGTARGTLPQASRLRVRAGSAAVEVRMQGYLTVQRQVMVPAGGTARETVQLVPARQTAGPTAQPVQGQPVQGQPVQGQSYAQPGQSYQQAPTRTESRPRWGLFIGGTIMFAVPWVITWSAGLMLDEGGDATALSFIPAAGPFILLGEITDDFILPTLLVIDGLLQTAGLVMAVLGIALQSEVEVRAELDEGLRAPALALRPMGVPGAGAGLALELTHF
ncbi:MAG TPA: tetratricopeptide repeat protein [Sandaracinaceae bacterium LLY-WYZ-13_1]|nr:tetratricopeptide repeat protein [Sandaracinaceae bacterium LLY-WYZ-13_1]